MGKKTGHKNAERRAQEVPEVVEGDLLEDEEFQKELLALKEINKEKGGKPKAKPAHKAKKAQEEEEEEEDEEGEQEIAKKTPQALAKELLAKIEELNPVKLPWIERLDIASSKPVTLEKVDDDFKRELAFYEQALEAAKLGKAKVLQADVPFDRPDDYFAEMIKSDQHMSKIRQKLIDETQQIKRSEDAAKSRMMKKYAKQVQVQKLQDRAQAKNKTIEKVKMLRKGKQNLDSLKDDDFDISVDNQPEKPARQPKTGRAPKGANPGKYEAPKKSNKREYKDQKFGTGRKRGSKSNTAESTNYFGKGMKKTRTGLPPKAAGGGKVTKRPGKGRRQQGKGKGKK